jgi:hypothetical protein
LSTVHLQREQWRVTDLRSLHRSSVRHRRAALPLPLLLCLGYSPVFTLHVNSGEWQREQWRVTDLRHFHRPSVHHRHAALPLLLHLGCSPLFMVRPVLPKLKCARLVRPSKIKISKKHFSNIVFIKKISV